MNMPSSNIDANEVAKFDALAGAWWDEDGDCRPLHDINPTRLSFIQNHVDLKAKTVLDVGCGGGILTESLSQQGAKVTGIDMGESVLKAARSHAKMSNLTIDYQKTAVEDLVKTHKGQFDIVTCMELLEHVPDPASIIQACVDLTKEGGQVFFSTINRTAKAYLFAILAAEYILRLLPKGTHEYKQFIRPSELDRIARQTGLQLIEIKGMNYHPKSRISKLCDDVNVNYLVAYQKS